MVVISRKKCKEKKKKKKRKEANMAHIMNFSNIITPTEVIVIKPLGMGRSSLALGGAGDGKVTCNCTYAPLGMSSDGGEGSVCILCPNLALEKESLKIYFHVYLV